MTDKELQKLGRRELLQLLLDQAKETDRVSKLLKETEEQLNQMEEGYERLRERLDRKDVRIHELQDQINELQGSVQNEKEKRIADLSEVGSIAEAALRLNGVFDAAQRAANQYLQSVKELYAIPDGTQPPIEIEPEPQPDWDYRSDESYAPEPPRSRPPEPGRYRAPEPPPRSRQYPPEEPQAEWDFRDDGAYAPEPPRSRPPEPGRYRAPEPPPRPRQYPPEEPGLGQEPRRRPAAPERRSEKREASSQSKLPFRVKKKKENGKTTLFFGWQHD